MWHIDLMTFLLCFKRTIHSITHWTSPSALDALRAQFFKVLSTVVHKTTNGKSVKMTWINVSKCLSALLMRTSRAVWKSLCPWEPNFTSWKQDIWRRETEAVRVVGIFHWHSLQGQQKVIPLSRILWEFALWCYSWRGQRFCYFFFFF